VAKSKNADEAFDKIEASEQWRATHHHSKPGQSLKEKLEAHSQRLWEKPTVNNFAYTLGFNSKDQKFLNEICDLTGLSPQDIFMRSLHFYGTAVKAAMNCLSQNDLKSYFEETKETPSETK
jgi:hypothetical protein